jgi:uncharacterized protein (TIGR03086 family)
MTEIADRYRRLSAAFAERIAAVPPDRWDDPSPCEDWKARDVVTHVVETQGMFLRFVGRELGPIPSVHDDPAAAWDAARAVVQAGLDDPERAGEEFDGFFGRTRWDAAVDRFLNFDLVIHAWDLAKATGQDDRIDPDDVQRVFAAAREFGDAMRAPSAFGPEVEPPPDADEQARLMAFLGRSS